MRRRIFISYYLMTIFILLSSCHEELKITRHVNKPVFIYPDYIGVTIPPNIAPMNFKVKNNGKPIKVLIEGNGITLQVTAKKGDVIIPEKKWKRVTEANKGNKLTFTVCQKEIDGWVTLRPFHMMVAEEVCDSHIAYRLIEPVYEVWNKMALYQRNLENFDVSLIFDNRQARKECISYHSFIANDPDKMLFQVHKANPEMILIRDKSISKISTKSNPMELPIVYSSWHNSGNYIALSTDKTILSYHTNENDTAKMHDNASNVVMYDVNKNQLFTTSTLSNPLSLTTHATFSADGQTLYFCTAPIPSILDTLADVKYSLCSVDFDPDTGSIGNQVDTLYNAYVEGKSLSFPRFSPDGKFMMFTRHDGGVFPIQHKESDLWMIHLTTGLCYDLTTLNSEESDSEHSWSSNSRWVVFSSRRNDGLYTRLYISYIDSQGRPSKPFQLPQKDLLYDNRLMKSYSIPEFTSDKIRLTPYSISTIMRRKQPISPSFR